MYAAETILKLKKTRSTKESPFPYDLVRVVGESPVDHGIRNTLWQGGNGKGVIITPLTAFGSTIDEPYGKLADLYEVETLPPKIEMVAGKVDIISQEQLGPSPEDIFSDVAAASGGDSRRSRKTKPPTSPLDGPDGPAIPDSSPLGPEPPPPDDAPGPDDGSPLGS